MPDLKETIGEPLRKTLYGGLGRVIAFVTDPVATTRKMAKDLPQQARQIPVKVATTAIVTVYKIKNRNAAPAAPPQPVTPTGSSRNGAATTPAATPAKAPAAKAPAKKAPASAKKAAGTKAPAKKAAAKKTPAADAPLPLAELSEPTQEAPASTGTTPQVDAVAQAEELELPVIPRTAFSDAEDSGGSPEA